MNTVTQQNTIDMVEPDDPPAMTLAPLQTGAVEQIRQPQARGAITPMDLMNLAMDKGDGDLERMERLMGMHERFLAAQAKQAFHDAMAEFKAEPLEIKKDKRVHFTSQKGTTDYRHATIGNVVGVLVPALAMHGLSHQWITKQDNKKITVVCRLTHKLGHSEEVQLTAEADTSGLKNDIQAVSSAITYLQRYTLLAITGTATSDQPDDDGAGYRRQGSEKAEPQPADEGLIEAGEAASTNGAKALVAWWSALTQKQRDQLSPQFLAWKRAAAKFDQDQAQKGKP